MNKFAFTIGLYLLVFCGSAQQIPQTRIVRLMLDTNAVDWRLSVNGSVQTLVSSENLTNDLAVFRLRQGDIILLGSIPNGTPAMAQTWKWIGSYCESNNVAIYVYGVYAAKAAVELFSIPIYNWKAPYDDPLNMASATFYREGQFLGKSTNGFHAMVTDIKRKRPRKLFILGSLYDIYRSFPPLASPYEYQRNELDAVLKAAGADVIELQIQSGL